MKKTHRWHGTGEQAENKRWDECFREAATVLFSNQRRRLKIDFTSAESVGSSNAACLLGFKPNSLNKSASRLNCSMIIFG